ncbi:MAG: MoxR family ATPase, partial [Proteobacteria bacterium]|nr:MoxR family ATPase [Pseudomonadota bacterium]
GYIAERPLATALYLAARMEKPIFFEGEPGVGKTEAALALSRILDTRLIRLQCYEGLDAASSIYEWNYPKQILRIRLEERGGKTAEAIDRIIFSEEFLIKRPLLLAITDAHKSPVLLIDELDRADEEFEAFLLEMLGDFQITIPELGTIHALNKPLVVVTSNRTRDIHDALKRRCLYHWIDYPDADKERRILQAKVPGLDETLAGQITRFMQRLRQEELIKRPGVSETIDWAEALLLLSADQLAEAVVSETLGCIIKYREDLEHFQDKIWADERRRAAYLGPVG